MKNKLLLLHTERPQFSAKFFLTYSCLMKKRATLVVLLLCLSKPTNIISGTIHLNCNYCLSCIWTCNRYKWFLNHTAYVWIISSWLYLGIAAGSCYCSRSTPQAHFKKWIHTNTTKQFLGNVLLSRSALC